MRDELEALLMLSVSALIIFLSVVFVIGGGFG